MERFEKAIAAQAEIPEDFFGGWAPGDEALFQKYVRPAAPAPGFVTDFLGLKTRVDMVPWAAFRDGQTVACIPLPDDQVRAEAIEYYAMLDALEHARPGAFTMIECGASYGPWTCVGGALACRLGKTRISLTAVEASDLMASLIPLHLSDNGIVPSVGGVSLNLVHGALAAKPGWLYFPKVASAAENGGQAKKTSWHRDYIGRNVDHDRVRAYSLQQVLPADRPIDLMHIDIQGHEYDVIKSSIGLLNESVSRLFIGTHSRLIEGQLLALLHENGWRLIRERPTKFTYRQDLDSIVGWTTRDGGQYWVGPRAG